VKIYCVEYWWRETEKIPDAVYSKEERTGAVVGVVEGQRSRHSRPVLVEGCRERCEGQRSQHAMPLCQAKTVLAETAEIRFLCCTYQNRFANVMNIS